MDGYFLDQAQGEIAELGIIRMRLIVSDKDTNGAFAVTEFRGGEGVWTVPHIHERMEESFYVLEGSFVFTLGDREVEADQSSFVMVPRGVPHLIRALAGGGALLAIFTPAGLERMFMELGQLPPASITDPKVRAEIARRHDSVPVPSARSH